MALSRLSDQKVISTNLNGFIGAQLTLLKNQRTQRNLDDETRFQSAVLADNLSYEDQVAYRTEQLKRVGGDREEKRRITTEIATLKDLIEQKNYNDAYVEELNKLNTGAASIDATVKWLQQRLANTTDQKIRANIQTNLSTMLDKQFQLQQDTLDKATTYAENNQSEPILLKQIDRVNAARKDALIAGNDNYVAVLDLQIQGLNKALNETKINNSLLNLSVNTITGQSAVATLDAFNNSIKSADTSTPVTIAGVRYDSAQAYWNSKRADYLNDQSDNGFFGRYQAEILKNTDYQISKGIFKTDSLKGITDAYGTLKTRNELADYMTKLDQDQQYTLGKAAGARATQVVNQFTTDLDAGKAVKELSTIQDTYGVDMTPSYQQIIQKASTEKESQLQSLIQATSQIAAAHPGMSQSDAFKKAVESGAGVTYSPEQLATKPADQLFQDAVNSKGASNPPITVDPQKAKDFQVADFKEGGLYKQPNVATTYIYQNGQLRPLAGQFSDAELRSATGKGFGDIQTIPSIGNVPIGTGIAKGEVISPAPAANNNQQKKITELVQRRPSAANPKVMEYYRADDPSKSFGTGEQLFSYLQSNGYTNIKDFSQVDPYFN